MKKKTVRRYALLAVAIAAIGGLLSYNYAVDQANAKGKAFGEALKSIQDELKTEQAGFDATLALAYNDRLSPEKIEASSQDHFEAMGAIIFRYDQLQPPPTYESARDLFKISTQAQLDRDRQEILFIQTGDSAHDARAKEFHQESFEYELAALADYKAAQAGSKP